MTALVLAVLVTGLQDSTGSTFPQPPGSRGPDPLVARATTDPVFIGAYEPAPVTVRFAGSVGGGAPPYSYSRNFGDGVSATGPTTAHAYLFPGTFVAALTVVDAVGEVATGSVTTMPTSSDGVHWVVAQARPALGRAPLTVDFDVTMMSQVPEAYDWDFGDGASNASPRPTHVYARGGVFVARLNVTEPDGFNASYRMTVVVIDEGPLEALATASTTGRCDPAATMATFEGFAAGGRGPYDYSWDFGDGKTSETQDPIHEYRGFRGLRSIVLTARDADGSTATASVSIPDAAPPCAFKLDLGSTDITLAVAVVAVTAGVTALAIGLRRRAQ